MRQIEINLTPEEYLIDSELKAAVAKHLHLNPMQIGHVATVKRSLDSRRQQVMYHTTLNVFDIDEPFSEPDYSSRYIDCSEQKDLPLIIVGAGPAGLFAALRALERGIRPIIVERGHPVEQRKLDVAKMVREQRVDPSSNWCFGEGGAGTFSDGKLFTRSTKRGNVGDVLRKFVEHGADPDILNDLHAHIGTDKLSPIIAQIRNTILSHGGEYHFGCTMTDLVIQNGAVKGILTDNGQCFCGRAVILATGHSARDVYELFNTKHWALEAKPFAVGVRVEHPQELINSIQYHSKRYSHLLPPASYSLTTQVDSSSKSDTRHGVFSFCMCPGGCIVPASTNEWQQVVNGMSDSKRNSPFANSGIAVTVGLEDLPNTYDRTDALSLLRFQQDIERKVFVNTQSAVHTMKRTSDAAKTETTSNATMAPAQRLTDFCNGKLSNRLNRTNYLGTCVSAPIHEMLPPFVTACLTSAFHNFDRKMRGFYTEGASILAVESRTSSPVRIPRGSDYQHIQLQNLYPCGEGAGYAGGIVSSALDGMNCVDQLT